jgi:DnaJ-domain-containing protein 1
MAQVRKAPTAAPCPRCGAERLSPLVCGRCGATGAAEGDPYTLLGLAYSWTVDPDLLEERYAAISRLVSRPEAAAGAAPILEALDAARRQLWDPLERARCLLKIYGGLERQQTVESPEFLTGVMEVREAYMDAIESGEDDRLAAVRKEAEEKLSSALVAAGQSFIRLERAITEELASAADALAVARYWRDIVDQMPAPKK